MKQNVTLSLETDLLQQAKVLAARRNLSLSKLLAEDIAVQVAQARQYDQAKQQALVLLNQKFALGGQRVQDRDELHDRQNLR